MPERPLRHAHQSRAEERHAVRRAHANRRGASPLRKAPLEWPAPRLENGWAPQGVAFEPSAFRQYRCGRSQGRPHHSTRGGAEAARRAHNPEAAGASPAPATSFAQILKRQRGLTVSGAFGLRRFESRSVHHFWKSASLAQWQSRASPSCRRRAAHDAQTWVRLPSAAPFLFCAQPPHQPCARFAWEANLVKAPL
jgi:hypothetical protein